MITCIFRLLKIIDKFPDTKIISNIEVKERLSKESILVSLEGNKFVNIETLKHERSFDKDAPLNTIYTLFNRLAHSGDNLQYKNQTEVMTLPIDCGTWGNVTLAMEKLVEVKPKFILPIHDFRIKDEIRGDVYKEFKNTLKVLILHFYPCSQETLFLFKFKPHECYICKTPSNDME